MTVTLGDILLVFLADQPATAFELQKRYVDTFGTEHAVDVTRVMAVLTRQERSGLVRPETARRASTQRLRALTEAGHRRQRSWLLDVRRDTGTDEILTRVLLALTAADRPTFDTVTGSCLAVLELRRLHARTTHPAADALSARQARAQFDETIAASMLEWLGKLRNSPRKRDHHPV
jgi:DNA-binding PadR family transcriptional regulator